MGAFPSDDAREIAGVIARHVAGSSHATSPWYRQRYTRKGSGTITLTNQRLTRRRAFWRRHLVRPPQSAMLHQRRLPPFVVSMRSQLQGPSPPPAANTREIASRSSSAAANDPGALAASAVASASDGAPARGPQTATSIGLRRTSRRSGPSRPSTVLAKSRQSTPPTNSMLAPAV